MVKKPEEFDSEDYRIMKKNAKAKKLLYFGIGPDEYARISNVILLKTFGMLYKWLMKVPTR